MNLMKMGPPWKCKKQEMNCYWYEINKLGGILPKTFAFTSATVNHIQLKAVSVLCPGVSLPLLLNKNENKNDFINISYVLIHC